MISLLSSDILASSLEPLEPPKFDASLLADLPFSILLDLLAISGLLNVEQDSTSGNSDAIEKSSGHLQKHLPVDVDLKDVWSSSANSQAKHSNMQAENADEDKNKENDSECVQVIFSSEKVSKEADSNLQSENSTSFVNTSTSSIKKQESSLWPASQTFSISSLSDITSVVEPIVKVCALKSLTVLLSSNTLLEILTTDVYTENSSSSEEYSQQRLNCMQTLLRSMVSYSVLPSPFRKVVNLMDLERAQNVLIRTVPSVCSSENVAVDKKAFSEGMFARV